MNQSKNPQYIRFLNSLDWQRLEAMSDRMQALAQTFHPKLNVEFAPVEPIASRKSFWQLENEKQTLACVDSDLGEKFCQTLLAEKSNCLTYQQVSQTMIRRLAIAFFSQPDIGIKPCKQKPTWFYRGSPSVQLTIKMETMPILFIYTSPTWMMQSFSPTQINVHPQAGGLAQVMKKEHIHLSANFIGNKIALKQLLTIQAGDVLQLDTRIGEPLFLCHNKHILAKASLGHTLDHKAVQIGGNKDDRCN